MTHNDKVFALLSDGKPHSHHEGYALNVMLHSRAADLRKRGHNIVTWRDGDHYVYQLLGVGRTVGDNAAPKAAATATAPVTPPPGAGQQLSLIPAGYERAA